MIGVNIMKAVNDGGAPPSPAFDMFITPSQINASAPNGGYTTATIKANTSGGQEPYSYSWSISNGNMSITSPTSQTTRVTASGYNDVVQGSLTCVATDDLGAEVTKNILVTIVFGDQLL